MLGREAPLVVHQGPVPHVRGDLPERVQLGFWQHQVVPPGTGLNPRRQPVQPATGVLASLLPRHAGQPQPHSVQALGGAARARLDRGGSLEDGEKGQDVRGQVFGVLRPDQQRHAVQGGLAGPQPGQSLAVGRGTRDVGRLHSARQQAEGRADRGKRALPGRPRRGDEQQGIARPGPVGPVPDAGPDGIRVRCRVGWPARVCVALGTPQREDERVQPLVDRRHADQVGQDGLVQARRRVQRVARIDADQLPVSQGAGRAQCAPVRVSQDRQR